MEEIPKSCITLIGMPGAGKSTVGSLLARMLDYAFVDTDTLIESLYARDLQYLTEQMPRETFLDVEAAVILALRASRCVIATGGSVIYRSCAMRWLKELGPVVHLAASLETVEDRIARKPDRGIAFAPDQSIADIYAERSDLYAMYADFVCKTEATPPSACVEIIRQRLGL